MSVLGFTLFETPIGPCGIVWSERGIAGVQFAEADANATRIRIRKRYPGAAETAPPTDVRHAIDGVARLLKGERVDLTDIALDTDGVPDFNRRVYEIVRSIPAGSTLSYGEIAEALGDKSLARDVGTALGQNPFPPIVPCHRVLAAGGKIGGFSAPGGVATKLNLLSIEGAQSGEPGLFDRLAWATPPNRAQSRPQVRRNNAKR